MFSKLNALFFFSLFFLTSAFAQTEARLVADLNPGTSGSFNFDFIPDDHGIQFAFGDKVVFVTRENNSTFDVWISDGTEANTTMLIDNIEAFELFNNDDPANAYFVSRIGNDYSLYQLDKSSLELTAAYTNDSSIKTIGIMDGTCYFASDNLLLKLDPQSSVTEVVYTFGSFRKIRDFNTLGNQLIIIAGEDDGTWLYASDGTAVGTQPYYQLNEVTNSEFSRDFYMTEVDNQLFFFYGKPDDAYTLHSTDGTAEGTVRLMGFEQEPFYNFEQRRSIIGFDGKLFFRGRAVGNSSGHHELFVSDGTVAGTQVLAISESNQWSNPSYFTVYQDELYFMGDEAGFIFTVYKTDGTQAGTERVIDRNALGTGLSFGGSYMTVYEDSLYLYGYRSAVGEELWVSGGTTESTRVIDLIPGSSSSVPSQLMATDNFLFFTYRSEAYGKELFVLDEMLVAAAEIATETLSVYPNPVSNGAIQVQLPHGVDYFGAELRLLNTQASQVLRQQLADSQVEVNNLPAGMYIIQLQVDNTVYTGKLIKQ